MELAEKRQSVRKYLDKPVEREKIERCLKAANLAPSACNSQPWYFIIADSKELKDKIAAKTLLPFAKINRFTASVPVIIALIAKKSNLSASVGGFLKQKKFNTIDTGIAAEHFCLQAVEEELGTCILGWFDEKKIKKILGIQYSEHVILLITVGYPADKKIREKTRKPLSQIYHYNKIQNGSSSKDRD